MRSTNEMDLNVTKSRAAIQIALFCVLVGFTFWNAHLTRQLYLTGQQIDRLSLEQQRLLESLDQLHPSSQVKGGEELGGGRTKRSAEVAERKEGERKVERRNEGGRRKKKPAGAHFVAHIDQDVLLREKAEGHEPTLGNLTAYGFVPKRKIYNIWKEEPYTNRRVFKYDKETGKVTVRRGGLYLVYGQMVFNGPFSRRSYGIYINDEYKPFIETLAYEKFHRTNNCSEEEDPVYRHRRELDTLGYSQCNTMAVTQLKKGDKVFLKSTENTKIIIPEKYLTFWGMALL